MGDRGTLGGLAHTSNWFKRRQEEKEKDQEREQGRPGGGKAGGDRPPSRPRLDGSSSSEDEGDGPAAERRRRQQRAEQQQQQRAEQQQQQQLVGERKEEAEGAAAGAPAGAAAAALEAEPSEEFLPEDRPRVLAYSDSDSDVESHIKRVSKHLRREQHPTPEEQAAAEAEAAAEAAAAAAAEVAQSEAAAQQARRGLGRAVGAAFASVAHLVAPHLTAGFAARLCTLLLLRRVNPSVEDALELLTLAIPVTGAAASKLGARVSLPAPVQAAGREAGQMGKAAAAFLLARLLGRGLREHRWLRQGGARKQKLRRMKSSVNMSTLEAAPRAEPAKPPETAAEFAVVFSAEITEMRRILQENGIPLTERFSDPELLRYASACGLLTAKTVEERAAAVEGGVRRILHTVEWLGSQRFLNDKRLRRWDRLVLWRSADAQRHPILLVRVGRALQLVKPERMQEFMDTILSQVDRGIRAELSDEAGRERMVVVLDARGASSLALTRHMSLLKHIAVTLNQHYPDRLHRLYLLELPLLLRWAVQVVLPLLHPVTRDKVVLSSMEDPDLPVTVAYLTKRRSVGMPLQRTNSEMTLPGSGGSTPGLLSPSQSLAAEHLPPGEPSGAMAAGPSAAGGAAAAGAALGSLSVERQARGAAAALLAAGGSGGGSPAEGSAERTRPRSLEAAWDAYVAQQAASPKPGSLEAAWDACQQSAGSARRSFEFLGVGSAAPGGQEGGAAAPAGGSKEASPSGRRSFQEGMGRVATAAAAAAAAEPPFPKSMSTPTLQHVDSNSSSIEAALLSPRHAQQYRQQQQQQQQWGGAAAAAAAGAAHAGNAAAELQSPPPPLGPGDAGGISSHAVALSPALSLLSREVSDATALTPTAAAAAAAAAAGPSGAARGSQASPLAAPRGSPGAEFGTPLAEASSGMEGEASFTTATSSGESGGAQEQQAQHEEQGRSGKWATVMGWLGRGPAPSDGEGEQQAGGGEQEPGGEGAAEAGAAAGAKLAPHRLGSFTSSRGSSAASSPRAPSGGLPQLPQRQRRRAPGTGLTPRKPSLRRESSLERTHSAGSGGQLGSHPLRHQPSVSWAEELEIVKEIAESPSPRGSPAQSEGGGWPRDPQATARALGAAACAAAAATPALVLRTLLTIMLVAILLQQLVLSGHVKGPA